MKVPFKYKRSCPGQFWVKRVVQVQSVYVKMRANCAWVKFVPKKCINATKSSATAAFALFLWVVDDKTRRNTWGVR